MAIHRLINASLTGTPFPLYGDGSAIRDFTYVEDVVSANLLAGTKAVPTGSAINIAGGSSTRLSELIDLVGELVGRPVPVQQRAAKPGDVKRTGGSIELAEQLLGWRPHVDLKSGLVEQITWHRRSLDVLARS
jgi:nucleoside-diphosphate-sugar epimerase